MPQTNGDFLKKIDTCPSRYVMRVDSRPRRAIFDGVYEMSQTNCPYTPSGPVHVDPLTPEELGDVARMAEDGLLDFPAAITHVFSDGVSTYDVLAFEEDEELSDFKKTLGDKAPRWIREARTVSAFVYAADYANSVIDHAVRRGQFDRMMEAYVSSKRRAS